MDTIEWVEQNLRKPLVFSNNVTEIARLQDDGAVYFNYQDANLWMKPEKEKWEKDYEAIFDEPFPKNKKYRSIDEPFEPSCRN